jgi:predicted thioesterase
MDPLPFDLGAAVAARGAVIGRAWLQVGGDDTAVAAGSGDVPVLATPRVLALAEAATLDALAPALPARTTTVGTAVTLTHSAPTPVGGRVVAEARVTAVDGRRLTFEVTVRDGEPEPDRIVATATIERTAVDRERFVAGLRSADSAGPAGPASSAGPRPSERTT